MDYWKQKYICFDDYLTEVYETHGGLKFRVAKYS
jgi:hypothetical protein